MCLKAGIVYEKILIIVTKNIFNSVACFRRFMLYTCSRFDFAHNLSLCSNLVPMVLTLGLFTFGCGCFLMHYGVYVNDLANVVTIVTRMLFYITGIFYNLETRIPEYGVLLNRYNPVAFLLSGMRKCLLYEAMPDLKMLAVWFAVGLVLSVLGVRKIYKEENSYVKSI